MVGFVNQFESGQLAEILASGWIYMNPAAREGLPTAFIEACGHKNAILSSVDPDGFASKFGCYVQDDDFHQGLSYLLEQNRWQGRAEKGYQYVRSTFQVGRSIERHLQIYMELLNL